MIILLEDREELFRKLLEKNTGPYMTQESSPPTFTPVSSPFLLVSRHHSEVSPFIYTEEYHAPHS